MRPEEVEFAIDTEAASSERLRSLPGSGFAAPRFRSAPLAGEPFRQATFWRRQRTPLADDPSKKYKNFSFATGGWVLTSGPVGLPMGATVVRF